jgi:hypothetical protein
MVLHTYLPAGGAMSHSAATSTSRGSTAYTAVLAACTARGPGLHTVPVTLLNTLLKLKSLLAHCDVPLALLAGDKALAHDEATHTVCDDASSDVSGDVRCSRCKVAASELPSSTAAAHGSSTGSGMAHEPEQSDVLDSSSSSSSNSSSVGEQDTAGALRVLCSCFEPPSISPQDDCFAMPVDFGAVRYADHIKVVTFTMCYHDYRLSISDVKIVYMLSLPQSVLLNCATSLGE